MKNKFVLLFAILCWSRFISLWAISDLSWAQKADTLVVQHKQSNWFPTSETRWRSALNGEWTYRLKGEKEWQKIQLPHPIVVSSTDGADDVWFFRKTFVPPIHWQNRRWYLVLNGVNYTCSVKINNRFVGTYSHGYCPFAILLDNNLVRVGKDNEIELKVDTHLGNHREDLLPRNSLLAPCKPGGIFRDLFFYVEPALGLSRVDFQSQPDGDFSTWILKYEVEVAAKIFQQELPPGSFALRKLLLLELQISDPDANGRRIAIYSKVVSVASNTANLFTGELKLRNLIPWSPSTPKIYRFDIYLKDRRRVVDHLNYEIGFRHLGIREGHVQLNGQPVMIHGVTVVEGVPMRQDPHFYIAQAKSLGANTIYWLFPPSPGVLDKCDQAGLLSIVGLPLWNTPGALLGDESVLTTAKAFFAALQTLSQFHPSLLAISLGSGFDSVNPNTMSFLHNLTSARSSVSSFFTMAGFRTNKFVPKAGFLSTQVPLDLICLNLSHFNQPDISTVVQQWRDRLSAEAGLFAEVGAPYIQASYDPEDFSGFEARQAYDIQQMLTVLHQDSVGGGFVLALNDWSGHYPSILTPCTTPQVFPFGLMNELNDPRMSWKVVQDFYQGKIDAVALPSEPGSSQDTVFIFWGFGVLIVFAYFFKKNSRFRGNFMRTLMRPRGFFLELKEARKFFWGHSILVALIAASTLSLIIAGPCYYLRESVLFDFVLSLFSIQTGLKRQLVTFIWHPVGLIVVSTLGVMVGFSLFAGYLKLISIFAGRFIPLRNAFSFIFLLSGTFIFLLPIALSFVRLLNFPQLHQWLFILVLIFVAWFAYRIFVGMKIVLDVKLGMVAIVLIVTLLAFVFVGYWIYDYHFAADAHLNYLYHIWKYGI